MAVNTKLLLPSSATQSIVGGDYTKKLKVKVIKLDKLLKGSVAIKKKELNESKREVSEDRKEEIEEKLETKPGKEKEKFTKKIKPKMGVFGFIKNFIGNILLGFFAVRLVDQLPKLLAIASVIGRAADFVIDVGGKLFDGLASFIDFGYKVSDGTRNLLESIGGENVVALFDGLIDKVSFVIDALILSTIVGGKNVFEKFFLQLQKPPQQKLKKPKLIFKRLLPTARIDEGSVKITAKRAREILRKTPSSIGVQPKNRYKKRSAKTTTGLKSLGSAFSTEIARIKVTYKKLRYNNTELINVANDVNLSYQERKAAFDILQSKGLSYKVTNIPELKLPPVTRIKPSVDVVKESTEAAKKLNKGSGSFDFLKKFKIPGLSQGRLGRIGLGLDVLFAGIDFKNRVDAGQSVEQAATSSIAGGIGGFVAGAKGGAAAGALGGSLFGPPGALIGGVLGGILFGTLGAFGAGATSDAIFNLFKEPVQQRNEGGPIRRAPEPVSVKKPKQISNPQPTRFDPDGDKKITENSKLLDKVDYFGPILGLAGKILMGQSPDSEDFRNVSLGLTAFIQRASLLGLVQSLTGYNQGGSVNFMSKLGEDITSWIADTFRSLITKPALNVISFIKEIVVKPFQQLFDGQINDSSKSKSMFDFNMPSPPPLMAPPSISASATSGNVKYDLLEQDPEFAKEVDRLSKKYNINPSHLLGLIASESGFDPKANNETHVGLIQFSKESAKLVGSSQAEILEMSRAQQMKLVEKYFDYWELPKGAGPGQLYMSVFLPSYTNKPSDYVVAKKGEAWYDDNVGLDVNQDGVITPSDLDNRVLKKMEEFGIPAGPSKTEDKKDDSSDVSSSDDKRHPGSITAGKLGKYLYQVLNSPKDFQAVTEHSEFGGVVGRHAEDSYHYSDRAIDIGAYTWEQEKILNAIKKFNEINGVSPVELITGYDDPAGHSDHVHIAYQKGGFVPRNVPAFLHKGEVVVDADSAGPAKNMLLAINQAKDTRGVMEAITQYAPYDVMSGETIVVDRKEIVDNTQPQPEQSPPDIIPVGGSDFFDSLDFVG